MHFFLGALRAKNKDTYKYYIHYVYMCKYPRLKGDGAIGYFHFNGFDCHAHMHNWIMKAIPWPIKHRLHGIMRAQKRAMLFMYNVRYVETSLDNANDDRKHYTLHPFVCLFQNFHVG